jgi:hypothetical protein
VRLTSTAAIGLAICAAFAYPSTAGALLTPIAQERAVTAEAMVVAEDIFQDSQTDAATDFSPFNANVTATAGSGGPQAPRTTGTASQQSQINPDSLIGTGGVTAHADAGFPNNMSATGASDFRVTFSVDQAVDYLLTGLLEASPAPGGDVPPLARALLSGPGGDIYAVEIESGSAPLLSAGILPPGEYELIVLATATVEASGHDASASFEFSFTAVPEPGTISGFALLALIARRRR